MFQPNPNTSPTVLAEGLSYDSELFAGHNEQSGEHESHIRSPETDMSGQQQQNGHNPSQSSDQHSSPPHSSNIPLNSLFGEMSTSEATKLLMQGLTSGGDGITLNDQQNFMFNQAQLEGLAHASPNVDWANIGDVQNLWQGLEAAGLEPNELLAILHQQQQQQQQQQGQHQAEQENCIDPMKALSSQLDQETGSIEYLNNKQPAGESSMANYLSLDNHTFDVEKHDSSVWDQLPWLGVSDAAAGSGANVFNSQMAGGLNDTLLLPHGDPLPPGRRRRSLSTSSIPQKPSNFATGQTNIPSPLSQQTSRVQANGNAKRRPISMQVSSQALNTLFNAPTSVPMTTHQATSGVTISNPGSPSASPLPVHVQPPNLGALSAPPSPTHIPSDFEFHQRHQNHTGGPIRTRMKMMRTASPSGGIRVPRGGDLEGWRPSTPNTFEFNEGRRPATPDELISALSGGVLNPAHLQASSPLRDIRGRKRSTSLPPAPYNLTGGPMQVNGQNNTIPRSVPLENFAPTSAARLPPVQIPRAGGGFLHTSKPIVRLAAAATPEQQRRLDAELERINFDDVTVAELKEMLRKRGKPATGKKAILMQRLLEERNAARMKQASENTATASSSANSSSTGEEAGAGNGAAGGNGGESSILHRRFSTLQIVENKESGSEGTASTALSKTEGLEGGESPHMTHSRRYAPYHPPPHPRGASHSPSLSAATPSTTPSTTMRPEDDIEDMPMGDATEFGELFAAAAEEDGGDKAFNEFVVKLDSPNDNELYIPLGNEFDISNFGRLPATAPPHTDDQEGGMGEFVRWG
ncbi:uncharacterized protein VTP21DRAFT_10879 [Calcarisporiella thermophila]|uniref:uncharacterized protein n=1 Tax=Calcarisporiella thermophila TaxID=911321 RepID=UPI0037425BB0